MTLGEDYPYDAKRKIISLIETLETLTRRDPEQEVEGIALPVLDAVIESVRAVLPEGQPQNLRPGAIAAARGRHLRFLGMSAPLHVTRVREITAPEEAGCCTSATRVRCWLDGTGWVKMLLSCDRR